MERGADSRDAPVRKVPIAWEALEDAFENNAPEVHSYLHLGTGEVIRVVDGVADPSTHGRIAVDSNYLRVDPVSSREQYRWMERFIATVEEGPLRQKLLQSIDGKGAFRRFKDVLVAFPVDRERWFTFRSERLRTCMESWLEAQGVTPVERPEWQVPTAEDVRPHVELKSDRPNDRPTESTERPVVRRSTPPPPRLNSADVLRKRAHDVIDLLSARELEGVLGYLEFTRERGRTMPPPIAAPSIPTTPPSSVAPRELSLVSPTVRPDRETARDRDFTPPARERDRDDDDP